MEKLKFSLYDVTLDEYSDNQNKDIDVYYQNNYVGTYKNKRIYSVTELIYGIVQKINELIERPNVRGIFISRDGSYEYVINPTVKDIFRLVSEAKLNVDDYIVKPLFIGEKYLVDVNVGEGEDFGDSVDIIPESKLKFV